MPKDAGLVPQDNKALNETELNSFYQQWRDRVHGWISSFAADEVADVVLLVPDLIALVGRLIQDPRTPLAYKTQLLLASAYVLLPVDFVPEVFLGAAGLADDAVVMSIVLMRLLQSTLNVDKNLLREHWAGKGDIVDTIKEIVRNDGEVVNTQVWQRIRTLFGAPAPEPAVVNQRPSGSRASSDGSSKRSSTSSKKASGSQQATSESTQTTESATAGD